MKKPKPQKPDKPPVEARFKRDKKGSVTAKAALHYRKGLDFEDYQEHLYRSHSRTDDLKETPIAFEITACTEDWQLLEAAITDDPDTFLDNLKLYIGAALQRINMSANPRGKDQITALRQSQMKNEATYLYWLLQYYADKKKYPYDEKPAFIQELQKATGKKRYIPLTIVYDLMKLRYGEQLKNAFKKTGPSLHKSHFKKGYVKKLKIKLEGNPERVHNMIRKTALFKNLFAYFKIKI